MKASVLVKPRTLEIQDREIPQPGPGEVRVKVMAVGLCGSDAHYYEYGKIGPTQIQYPTILGHEPAGVVDAIGPGAKLAIGTRVAIEPAMPCGNCEFCLSGHANICREVRFLGTPPTEGIYLQYRVMPEQNCLPIPGSLSLVEAAMLEPLTVGLHAVRISGLTAGDAVAIFGSGPIGLVTMMAARVAGAKAIFMADLVPERLQLARHLGADAILNPKDADAKEWVSGLTHGRGVDIAIEAAGDQEALYSCCAAARPGGKVIMIGSPKSLDLSIPMHDCRRKELLMQHVRRSNGETHAAIDLVASGQINIKPLATHFFSLEEAPKAFEMVHGYRDGVIRAVILPHGEIDENG